MPSQGYMIETAERAQERYEKNKRKPAPAGVSSFNAKTLYKAYLKRTGNVPTTAEEYQLMKQTAPEFYRAADSMLYGVSGYSQMAACLCLSVERVCALWSAAWVLCMRLPQIVCSTSMMPHINCPADIPDICACLVRQPQHRSGSVSEVLQEIL